jgi:outer membrane protein TolC
MVPAQCQIHGSRTGDRSMFSRHQFFRGVVIASAILTLAGCQSYRPVPLNLRSHAKVWAARNPASPEVAAYAGRLAASASAPTDSAFDPTDGISLREAEVIALFFNPQLRAARLKARVAAAGAAEAGRWEDPVLQVDAERIIQSIQHPWVAGGLVNLTLPLSGRLAVEKSRALAEADVARMTALLEEQRVLAELSTAWAELAVTDQRIELTRTFLSDLDAIVGQAEKLRAAGELEALEAGLFRVEQVRRNGELRSLAPQRREQELIVKSLMGLTPAAPVRLEPALPPNLDSAESTDRQHWIEQNHPRLRLAQAEYHVAERTLELEVRRQFPDLALGGGYGRDEGTTRILGGLSLPIPIFNANRRAIAEARANRDAVRASAEATYEELMSLLARAEAALESARVRREILERELAPLADQQLRAARNLGRLGAVNTVIVFEALTRAHEARIEILEAASREAVARNQINALIRPATEIAPATKEKP